MITRFKNTDYFTDLVPSDAGEWVAHQDVVDILEKCLQDETIDDVRGSICEEFGIDLNQIQE
jgi:hypothetical protein